MQNTLVLLLSLLLCVSAKAAETEKVPLGVLPPEACGVWSWYSWGGTPNQWNGKITADETYAGLRGIPIVVGWDKLEPEDGVYNWDLFDDIIKKAAANNKYVFTLLWINPTEPQWLYAKGVPKVEIDTFKGDPNFGIQAYPMDKKYKFYSERIITKLAEHLRSLPPELFKRVVFHQVVEGSTGDGFCYKGEPTDPHYKVTREEWADYQKYIRRFTVDAFSKPLDGKPPMALLIHTEDVAAGLKYYPGTVLKQGVPSHGYGSNTERSKFNGYKPWMTPDNPAGRPVFSRGEGETMIPRKGQTTEHSKWFQQNPQQNLYWTALGALQNGLDIWNLPEFVIEDPQWRQSLDIFNRYAGQKYPSKSPVAFCALRDELNADDTVRFPENKYGAANKKNTDRVLKICAEFADYGAVVQDLDKALAGGLKSRSRTGYNDVAWDRIDEDYCRFLYPIDKLETSVGWWNVGPKDQPYGKFARGFEHKSGKDALYFGFHKDFFKNDGEPVGPLTFRVVWFDNTTGSWGFSYDAGKGNFKSAKTFTGTGTGRWREETFTITDAVMNHNGPRGADIALVNLDDKDKIFHLIEVSRDPKAQPVTRDSADKSADAKAGRKAANKKEHDFGKWEKAIAAYEKEDAANPPPRGGIQFVGSSTIRKWTTLKQDFPGQPLFNRGFGGSQIKDTTFFASRIIIPYAPRIIVFHAGDNDLAAGATHEQVIADLKELVATIQAKLPETEFCYISLKPSVKREHLRAEQQKVNEGAMELRKSNSRFHYIDQYYMVTDAMGNPRPELFAADALHLSEAGYRLLVERVRPFLKKIHLKPEAEFKKTSF